MKICSKCKVEKDLSEFSKDVSKTDKLYCSCKKCVRKTQIENKEKIFIYRKKYLEKNKEKIAIYHKNNHKKYNKSKANYNTYAEQISYADKVKNVNGFLQTKCTYCGKWYFPITSSIQRRVSALNGQCSSDGTENRLYCSTECKKACPIFAKHLYPEGFKNYLQSREVQPELRQMVFKRDEYTCIKCGKHQDELDVPLHCHHIEGIIQNPIESADIDICVTVCKDCHKEIHQEDGCKYNDMKCKNKE